jgi:hypothetical protein
MSGMQGKGDSGRPSPIFTASAATALFMSVCNPKPPFMSSVGHCADGQTGGGADAAATGHGTASRLASSISLAESPELTDCLDSAGSTSGSTKGLAGPRGLAISLGVSGSPGISSLGPSTNGGGGGGGGMLATAGQPPPKTAAGAPHCATGSGSACHWPAPTICAACMEIESELELEVFGGDCWPSSCPVIRAEAAASEAACMYAAQAGDGQAPPTPP